MDILDRVNYGDLAPRSYSRDMDIFKKQIKEEAGLIDTAIKEKVDKLGESTLQNFVFEHADVYRLMRKPISMMRYPALCMEIMEAMTTPEEKYAAYIYLAMQEKLDENSSFESVLKSSLFKVHTTSTC